MVIFLTEDTPNLAILASNVPPKPTARGIPPVANVFPSAEATPLVKDEPRDSPPFSALPKRSLSGFTNFKAIFVNSLPILTIGSNIDLPKTAAASWAWFLVFCNKADILLFSSSFFFLASSVAVVEILNALA